MVGVIVIGGGPAGVTAALRARELGASVALVERDQLGGTCTNDGCVPTRVLAHAARLMRDSEQFSKYALSAPKPFLDFPRLLQQTQSIVYSVHEKKQLVNHLQESGVALYLGGGNASFLDAHTLALGDGSHLEADKFIIAAGGHARRIDFPGAELAITHSDVWTLKTLPRSLAIIGGSATGCQVASIFSDFGCEVHLMEVNQRLLPIEDELLSQTIYEAFSRRGIHITTGLGGVDHIERDDQGLVLYYKMGNAVQSLQVEAVMLAVGWPGNADMLNLAATGISTARGYIQVNDFLQTSTPNIFAAGDITGRMMLVQSATIEALAAVENAVLGVGQPQRHQLVPHGGFTDPEYGSVGLTEAKARAEMDVEVAVVRYAEMDRAVIDGHTDGFCKLIVSRENHRVVGAHVAGEQALEVVQFIAAGMAADIWVEQLADLEISYPTYTAIVGLAARRVAAALGVVPLSKEWRTLGRINAAEWERAQFE